MWGGVGRAGTAEERVEQSGPSHVLRVGALVMTERLKLRVVREQDKSRRTAAERAKFSKWIETSCCSHGEPGWGAELDLSGC